MTGQGLFAARVEGSVFVLGLGRGADRARPWGWHGGWFLNLPQPPLHLGEGNEAGSHSVIRTPGCACGRRASRRTDPRPMGAFGVPLHRGDAAIRRVRPPAGFAHTRTDTGRANHPSGGKPRPNRWPAHSSQTAGTTPDAPTERSLSVDDLRPPYSRHWALDERGVGRCYWHRDTSTSGPLDDT